MSGSGRLLSILALAVACLAASPRARAAASEPFPEPEALRPAVAFWTRVYIESTTDGGFVHDARHLGIVYELVRFDGERNSRRREAIVDRVKDRWSDALDRLALGAEPRNDAERTVLRSFNQALGRDPDLRDIREAKKRMRFQLGQRDKFRDGLIRSGAFEAEMRGHFREQGLPEDLAYLPHVESSFNVHAYSKYGAAGAWQFMRSTGKRFMKVDYVVDERLDPITSTRAAARLLRENYGLLGSWPLALTAYNHGAAGMNRAVKKLGTSRIDVIVERYESPSFGFASRNFYAQFLAARRIVRSYESYFGPLERDEPRVVDTVSMPFYADVRDLERNLGVSRETIADLNPALRPPVFRSGKRIPKGYTLRLPAGTVVGDASTWLAAVPKASRHPDQHANRYYTVRRGDTLGRIASKHRTSVAALVAENDIGARRPIYPGQVLQIPDRSGRGAPADKPFEIVRTAEAGTLPTPKAAADAVAQPETQAAAAPPVAQPETAPESTPAVVAEAVAPAPAVVAELEPVVVFAEPEPVVVVAEAEPVVVVAEPEPVVVVTEAEPVVVAEPEPAAAPALETRVAAVEVEVPQPAQALEAAAVTAEEMAAISPEPPPGAPDDSPFRRVDKERVIVDADETLGHFAEWLEITPQRLRNLNKLKPRRQIRAGQTLRLDFSKVSPEEFQQRRLEYHKGIEEDFFGSYRVSSTLEHTLRPGETLWVLSHKKYAVPTWLIRRYNPDVDLGKLVPGVVLVIPIVEKAA
ncbi:MAG: LysM peptidoglycan-binding domain-containing protein [Myxococcota bacterium]